MTVTRPQPRILQGSFVSVEPLTEEHLADLWSALGVPAVFAGGYGGGPAGLPADEASFVEWLRAGYLGYADRLPFAIRLNSGPDAGRIVGVSTLGDLDEANANAHIGWTAYAPNVWGTTVNPETKLLLLGFAFDNGYNRVRLQADSINARSRAAILKLGATFEGILRRHLLRADGSWRDTAVYSVIESDWPGVKAGLLARLDGASKPSATSRDAAEQEPRS
ncbi:GNAT family N-acetyltransferase [Salinibacterium sp. SWN139]|uniref:GNAT family N-acetyltransferase n=1 Tax=Salinibacterium sp. SWN139 TaxID=2792055 RepID=UPI0018CFC444|nr:GNAT family protein [Salinibacterium sp. SWN139]MBH0052992.1 GNAT family N-acetyltransferase [Salinibacterium sp. SWN139]